jgi:hypothetical protein
LNEEATDVFTLDRQVGHQFCMFLDWKMSQWKKVESPFYSNGKKFKKM